MRQPATQQQLTDEKKASAKLARVNSLYVAKLHAQQPAAVSLLVYLNIAALTMLSAWLAAPSAADRLLCLSLVITSFFSLLN